MPNDSVNIVTGSKVTIASGKVVAIGSAAQGGLVIAKGGTLNNSGTITVGAGVTVSNYGTVTNNASGTITNNSSQSSIINQSGGTLANSGTITNNSQLTNYGTLTNSGTIVNNASITSDGYAAIYNSGTLQLNGLGIVYCTGYSLSNPPTPMFTGMLFSNGVFVQEPGSIIVLGSGTQLCIAPAAGEGPDFSIPQDASLVISYGASLTIQAEATLDNAGTVSNSGGIAIVDAGNGLTPGAINNSGTLTNNAGHMLFKFPKGKPYETQGSIANSGTITNRGTLNNGWSGRTIEPILMQPTITNSGPGSAIGNSGTVTNYGTIDNGGIINNSGVFHKDGGVLNGSAIKGNQPVP